MKTFDETMQDAGVNYCCLWETKGPKGTAIAKHACFKVGDSVVYVQTYHKDNGWNAFTCCRENDIAATLADIFNRCNVKVPQSA